MQALREAIAGQRLATFAAELYEKRGQIALPVYNDAL